MYLFYIISLCLVAVVVLYLLWHYPNAQTTVLVRLIVGLAWFGSLSVLVLVPVDVKHVLMKGHEEKDGLYGVSTELLGSVWAAVYWTMISFILLILPFLQKYSDSGAFSIRDRCEYAIRRNGQLFVAAVLILLTGFLMLFLVEREVTFSKFVGWIMAVLNAYGLIGAICLMGYGLVDIPRKLWLKANHTERHLFLCQTAGMQIERAAEAHLELSREVNSVHRINRQFGQADDMRPYMDIIVSMLDRVPGFEPQQTEEDDEDIQLDTNTRQGLGILRQRLRKGIEGYYRERQRYLSIVAEYLHLHETMQNRGRRGMPFVYLDDRKVSLLGRHWAWWWRCGIKPMSHRMLALITGILSLLIVLAEVTIADYIPNLSVFAQVLQALDSNEVALIAVTFLILFYAMACMYYTLVRLGRFSFYRLVPKHTAPFSLASNALLLCRFVCSLCFNFFTAVALPIKDDTEESVEQTEFWDTIGKRISEMPVLGKYFTTYIPIVMLPYVLLIAFNGINRVMTFLDPKLKISFRDDQYLDMSSNYVSNGRRVMNLEVEYCQRKLEPGLTLTEGMRLVGVSRTSTALAPGAVGSRSARTHGSSAGPSDTPGLTGRTTPVMLSTTPGTMVSPFDLPLTSPFLKRSSSLDDPTASGLRTPLIPSTQVQHQMRRSAQDIRISNVSCESLPRTGTGEAERSGTDTLVKRLSRFFLSGND